MSDTPLQDFFETERGNPEAFRYYVRLSRIRTWLTDNYSENASLTAAAEVVGLNAKYFSRFFRAKTGVRFSDWVNAVRVQRATELLRQNNWNVTLVAFEVGYKDLRTFERAFKKYVGVTAREYRNTQRPTPQSPVRIRQAQWLRRDSTP